MEARSPKHAQKKAYGSERSVSTKKTQLHKKKKKHNKKAEGKEIGKSSTSPEAEMVMSDLATDVESDVSATSKDKTMITMKQNISKYAQVGTSVKPNQRKHNTTSPKAGKDKHQSHINSTNSPKQTREQRHLTHTTATATNSPRPNRDQHHMGYVTTTSSRTTKGSATYSSKGTNKENVSKKCSKPNNSLPTQLHQESLRWDYELSDSESEQDRIRIYKLNRRKRYLATFKQNYSEWLASGMTGDGSSDIHDVTTHEGTMISHGQTTVNHEQSHELASRRKIIPNRGLAQESVVKNLSQGAMSKLSYTKLNQDIMIKC